MNRIIITPENRDFVVVDLDTGKTIHEHKATRDLDCPDLNGQGRQTYRPFGIAEDTDHFYIASNNRLGQFNKTTYQFERLVDVPLYINTHQILKDGNTLYTCNTAIDAIGVYNIEHKQLNINYMNVVKQTLIPKNADQLDSRHVNSLFDAGDNVFFIRHNRGIVASDIGFFDKRTLTPQILTNVGKCCHGIRIVENVLYTLSTATGELVSIDLNTLIATKYKIVDPNVTFLRGLDHRDGKLVIGCSVNFKTNTRDKSCHILVVDLQNISYKTYELDGIKVINDLKILT
ncbi:hypothetical protein UFOVP118_68 [uncultured Caudovirales phage]|uniref:Uncharacterized protein n=1 Tax=uncultured Caudovirales phage TaxID=2100421 RepID=A0A6J5L568_9CAUD|nr:hypothetical protein UFOVP118_68 [uncultured Caudovirales phage]